MFSIVYNIYISSEEAAAQSTSQWWIGDYIHRLALSNPTYAEEKPELVDARAQGCARALPQYPNATPEDNDIKNER